MEKFGMNLKRGLMAIRFNRKIAKEIAATSFSYVIDCILGNSDTGYNLDTGKEEFETNFEEDLEEKDIIITDKRIKIIGDYYEKFRDTLKNRIIKTYQ